MASTLGKTLSRFTVVNRKRLSWCIRTRSDTVAEMREWAFEEPQHAESKTQQCMTIAFMCCLGTGIGAFFVLIREMLGFKT
mgnify:CR=1 FL=1